MPKFNPPEPLDFSRPQDWPEWKQRFTRFRSATKLKDEDGDVQVSSLIYAMGKQAEGIFNSFTFTPATDSSVYDKVLTKFNDHFIPKRNVIHERAIFHKRQQNPGENVESFIRNLYEQAEHCAFDKVKNFKEESIRDRIVVGLLDKEVSTQLQLKSDLTLQEAIQKARQAELVKSQVSTQTPGQEQTPVHEEVEMVQRQARGQRRGGASQRGRDRGYDNTARFSHTATKCTRCNGDHDRGDPCPAKGTKCRRCGKPNHYAICCRTQQVQEVTYAEGHHETAPPQTYFLGTVMCDQQHEAPWEITLKVAEYPIKFKIDTGADISIIPEAVYHKIRPRPPLQHNNNILKSASGRLECKGTFTAKTTHNEREYQLKIYVANTTNCLLSRSMAKTMGLIQLTIDEIVDEVADGTGILKGDPVKIQIKEGATPYHVNTARRVPIPLLPKVEQELQRMEAAGVIEKVTEPTEWCAPMVATMKRSGDVRICVDMRHLNRVVKRERYILPTLEDIKPKLLGSCVYSKLDAAAGYHQVELHPDSHKLTTFITPIGRYCFKRLPFGITSASEIFERKMAEILHDIEGVASFQDDVIVVGKTEAEHDERLAKVLKRLNDRGLRLNKAKCEIKKEEIDFLGHRFNKHGAKPDPNKVKAIKNMESPANLAELRRVVGMINYLGQYIPNLATTMKPMTDLLSEDAEWAWGPAQEDAYKCIKDTLTSAPVLAYYNPNLQTTVSADASSYGLGAVLMQKHGKVLKPIAFASRTMSPTEKRYAQIEKECLAAVWACEKFHRYLCGLDSFRLITDHKPLVPLINATDLDRVPIRCQRLLMRLMRYNPIAEHEAGTNIPVADLLSRQPQREINNITITEDVECHIEWIQANWPASVNKLLEIRRATKADKNMQEAMKLTINGWPKYHQDVNKDLKGLFEARNHLSVADGMLLYDSRIAIPTTMREEMMQKLHHGHLGITKCRERADMSVWWPGITKDIKAAISQCNHCQRSRPTQRREPLITTPLPHRPWEHVGSDIAEHKGQKYLVVTDYYSRYLEVVYLASTTSSTIINKLKCIFARWGIPQEMTTDNATYWTSNEFAEFTKSYDFKHVTMSPHYHQSNGAAERAVQNAKKILNQTDPFLALMIYRATPIEATGHSPAQLIMGRQPRTTIPTLAKNLEPHWPENREVEMNDRQAKEKYEQQYNKRYSTHPLPELSPGDQVRIKTDEQKEWSEPATVVEKANTPRSYRVHTPTGSILTRNRRHIQLMPQVKEGITDIQQSSEQPAPRSAETPTKTAVPLSTKQQQTTRYGRVVKPVERLTFGEM